MRGHPGLRGKRELAAVAAVWGVTATTPAVLDDGDGLLVMAAEAIQPPFVAAQPRAAGVAGVVTVLNDLAATGARPLGAAGLRWWRATGAPWRTCSTGLRTGAELYGVPVVGGHATVEAARRRGSRPSPWGARRAPLRRATPAPATRCAWPPAWRAR